MNEVTVKSVLNKTKSTDSWFLDDYTLNPYSGCSFNCLYCYIRGSKYGEHMEIKTSAKINAPLLLEKQLRLRASKNQYGYIVVGSATDPYLHFEEEMKLTRQLLEIIYAHRFPVHIITKSALVERDFDLIHDIGERAIIPARWEGKLPSKSFISFSFSTVSDSIGAIFEPGAPLPSQRLLTLKKAIDSGFWAGVSMMPLLPYISDTGEHLRLMMQNFTQAGARYLFPSGITLFGYEKGTSRYMVMRAVEKHYPQLLDKYHRLFDQSDYLPPAYHMAFMKKMKELCHEFSIPDRIQITTPRS